MERIIQVLELCSVLTVQGIEYSCHLGYGFEMVAQAHPCPRGSNVMQRGCDWKPEQDSIKLRFHWGLRQGRHLSPRVVVYIGKRVLIRIFEKQSSHLMAYGIRLIVL